MSIIRKGNKKGKMSAFQLLLNIGAEIGMESLWKLEAVTMGNSASKVFDNYKGDPIALPYLLPV